MIQIHDDVEINHEIFYSPFDGPVDLGTCILGEPELDAMYWNVVITEVGSQKTPNNSLVLELAGIDKSKWSGMFSLAWFILALALAILSLSSYTVCGTGLVH